MMLSFRYNDHHGREIETILSFFILFVFFLCYCPLAIIGRKAKKLFSLKHHSTFKGERKHNK